MGAPWRSLGNRNRSADTPAPFGGVEFGWPGDYGTDFHGEKREEEGIRRFKVSKWYGELSQC